MWNTITDPILFPTFTTIFGVITAVTIKEEGHIVVQKGYNYCEV